MGVGVGEYKVTLKVTTQPLQRGQKPKQTIANFVSPSTQLAHFYYTNSSSRSLPLLPPPALSYPRALSRASISLTNFTKNPGKSYH